MSISLLVSEKNSKLINLTNRDSLGTAIGYIKIWLMIDYHNSEPVKICMPKYRLTFPFLWKDIWVGRAKRMTRGQHKPMLLSSFKAHQMAISALTYLEEAQIIVR